MKGLSNSIPTLQVNPRISILAAIDNYGAIYVSLSQANTSSAMMKLFLWELAKTLDAEDADWRKTTMIMHDGAPYFCSADT